MPAAASYTESSLATYMVAILDSVATDLGLTNTSPSILAAITEIEDLLDVSDVATLTDMAVLRAAARWKAWSIAYALAAAQPDELKAGSAGLKWSDRLDGLKQAMEYAEGAYYVAVAASETASGVGSAFFGFATVCGGRGR